MSYTVGKSVSVRMHKRGAPFNGAVGVNVDGTIFGYVSQFHVDSLSHMSYYLDKYFVPREVVAQTRKNGGKFYFDAGNEITINADVLEDAFRRLGIL